MNTASTLSAAGRTGRPVDRSSDSLILESTLELLAERDYEHLTMDEVAARTGKAKTTLYRRWATKEELVLAAIAAAGLSSEAESLPDLGSLRADLLAVIDSDWLGGPVRRMTIFANLASATRSSRTLAAAIRSDVTEPYVDIYRRLLDRAAERGQIGEGASNRIPLLAAVIPAMSTHRMNSSSEPLSRDFFVSVVDDVVLPALSAAAP
ncbi:TetR/AcrR family transcriptional regulator [Agreia sp. COWG]|uniref:TetR/AcrR family transcriptional regulator n=1 Tax=Agreia sp. COWG TaxID=2773266 RepID=UPI001926C8C9|nr:TetR/AcrR family transcriptional regulator [Agreia sp. COWG]CAD5990008.1 Transcriptional regulator, TetR family [Agreia sp. COWG]